MLSSLLLGAAFLLGAPGDAQVSPNPVRAGEQIEVVATCTAGVTSATVSAASLGGASGVPMLESHATSTEWVVTLTIPAETQPGTYDLGGTCGDGTGFTARTVVGTVTGPMAGGGSTSDGPDTVLLSLGTGLLSVALIGGALVIRRRPTP
jgi:hypothetical protein